MIIQRSYLRLGRVVNTETLDEIYAGFYEVKSMKHLVKTVVLMILSMILISCSSSFVESGSKGYGHDEAVDRGDPIFYDFNFDGITIKYKYDNSNDKFGSSNVKSTVCKDITRTTEGTSNVYKLEGCTGKNAEIGSNFSFRVEM